MKVHIKGVNHCLNVLKYLFDIAFCCKEAYSTVDISQLGLHGLVGCSLKLLLKRSVVFSINKK